MPRTLLSATTVAVATVFGVASAAVSQVHLGLSSAKVGCANGISVSFASDVSTAYTVTATPNSASVATKTVQSTSVSYHLSEAQFNYTYDSPSLHTALLCDLPGRQQYAYSIGTEFTGTFTTPPHAGADDVETILGVVGDPGDTTYSETTLSEMVKPFEGKSIQALVIAGDYSYANGEHRQWDNWFNEQMNVSKSIPFTGINGNHETVTSSGHLNAPPYPADHTLEAENYLGYIKRVYTPISEKSRADLKTWYSLDIGLIHSVFLDDYTGSNGTNTSVIGTERWLAYREEQLAWLKADLAAVDRSVTPWVIVFKHNPYYNTWSNHQCQCSSTIFDINDADAANCWKGVYFSGTPYSEPHCGLQAKFEDVYSQYKVNIVMAGHVHGYERTNKIYKNKVDTTNGVYYVTTGGGGNYEGHAGPRLAASKVPSWSLANNNVTFGASRVIATRKSLRAVWFANDFLNEVSAVATDGFTINADGSDVITWSQTPSTPSTAAPATPATTSPATPATTSPVSPSTPATIAPATPSTPATTAPVSPSTTSPSTPSTPAPTTSKPSTPSPTTTAPVTPGTQRPSC
ncbi:Purple acid phosphatase 18, partial [Globisporangium splendens]